VYLSKGKYVNVSVYATIPTGQRFMELELVYSSSEGMHEASILLSLLAQ